MKLSKEVFFIWIFFIEGKIREYMKSTWKKCIKVYREYTNSLKREARKKSEQQGTTPQTKQTP